jgi:tRNA nucleotidyltransferase/poly(A) polymerase
VRARLQLLGLEPKDYDVATDAPPPRVRELFPRTQAVGAAFGVILVRQGRSQIEVATFRSEGKYLDGRPARERDVHDRRGDAKRRDFTINGMFYDPIEDRVIDYVSGQQDLKAGVLRAIGNADERFAEDHLRVLRAIRFAARFALTIEPATDAAVARNVPHLTRISPERIADELRVALTPPTRVMAWAMIQRHRVDSIMFRFLKLTERVHPEIGAGRATVFDRVLPGATISFGLAIAAATLEYALARVPSLADWNDVSVRKAVQALRESLKISNEESDAMEGTLYGLGQLVRNPEPRVAMLKRFLARPTMAYSRALLAALPDGWVAHRASIERQLSELEKTDFAPPPLITGDDLTAAGLKPGPAFKRALDEAYDAQLEGSVNTKPEALELAIRVARGKRRAGRARRLSVRISAARHFHRPTTR